MDWYSLRHDTDIAAPDAAIAQEAAGHKFRGIDANCETQALGRQDGRGIHAYHTAVGGNQRSAGVAWIQRGIGLNHVIDQTARVRAQGTSQRAYHASGHGGLEAVRVADGYDELSYTKLLRITQRCWHQAGRIRANYRDISCGIVTDGRRWNAAAVRQSNFDAGGAVHHVAVGENQAVWGEYKS